MSRAAAVRVTVPREPVTRGTTVRTSTTASPRTSTARTSTARTSTARTASARVTGARTTRPTTRPELRLVPTVGARPRRRARGALLSRKATVVLLMLAMLSLTTVGLLVLNTAIAVDSLQASKLRAANAERAQEVQRLEREVVSGATPTEIAREAADAGLVPAGVPGYLVIGPEATAMRGTPEPAPAPGPAPAPAPAPAEGPAAGTPGGN
ncbi:hypothetical protein [Blastococcus sp. LR1]|uniref:hypothetical protein n=1 Tax=Blastococcus sp. LR1 TaxID=2877000 RepID=UPI001CC91CD3|nr:hypothetical protein [Blastococcus sp. LR1]MCA0143581.1 hypothetical protein [Blastococcus sp. LR1]